jgi:hypothetical protein
MRSATDTLPSHSQRWHSTRGWAASFIRRFWRDGRRSQPASLFVQGRGAGLGTHRRRELTYLAGVLSEKESRRRRCVFLLTLLVSAFTRILFGRMPALHASRGDIAPLVKDGASQSGMGFREGPRAVRACDRRDGSGIGAAGRRRGVKNRYHVAIVAPKGLILRFELREPLRAERFHARRPGKVARLAADLRPPGVISPDQKKTGGLWRPPGFSLRYWVCAT